MDKPTTGAGSAAGQSNEARGAMGVPGILRSFFKIGVIGFGGGSALIPIVEQELVENRRVMDRGDYLKHTVVANITPGALPVKLGATCGWELGCAAGSLSGAYAVMMPGALLTVAIMALFTGLGPQAVTYIHRASVGISAFIIFLLLAYVRKTVKTGHAPLNLGLCAAAFLVTGGKEVRLLADALLGAELAEVPFLDISTIDLMIASFFLILLHAAAKSKAVLGAGCGLCAIYALLAGKWAARAGLSSWGKWLIVPMVLLLALCLAKSLGGKKTGVRIHISRPVAVTMILFLLVPVVITLCALLPAGGNVLPFLGQICLSTVTSFGGGEAYVSVADGIFVQGGYITSELFYTRLVPVANALPGPILVKIAAGIGYAYGLEQNASLGYLLAAAAAAWAVGVCSALAVLAAHVYDAVKESAMIRSLKTYILPVICGMLLSTSCALLHEGMKVMAEHGLSYRISCLVPVLWVAGLFLVTRIKHINDTVLLLISAAVSVLGLSMF